MPIVSEIIAQDLTPADLFKLTVPYSAADIQRRFNELYTEMLKDKEENREDIDAHLEKIEEAKLCLDGARMYLLSTIGANQSKVFSDAEMVQAAPRKVNYKALQYNFIEHWIDFERNQKRLSCLQSGNIGWGSEGLGS